jgi:chromate transporter
MSLLLLYLLMLKATLLSMNGQSSLPIVRQEFVVKRHVLTDRQLNAAVTVAQSSPGPMGGYVVSAGYFIGGTQGAAVSWLALVTPAFLVIPLMLYVGRRADSPALKRSLDAVVIAGSALILQTAWPMALDSGIFHGALPALIAAAAFATVLLTRVPTALVIGAAALLGWLSAGSPS